MEVETDAKRFALNKGVVSEESELFFSGGKDNKQNFGNRSKGARASLTGCDVVLMHWRKDDWHY